MMNKLGGAILAVASLSGARADENYETNYAVSKSGVNVKYVYQVSAQGSHTPKALLNLAKNKDEEAKYADYVTPLGIRQQYMIGNELRYRYVEETTDFLDDLYNITQVYIQTSWNDTSILSAQAMLLGLYPPGKNNYVIKEEQKMNAVPPIDGFDFKPWIDEMGLEALPHQTTIFPIQMNGWSYDYMLALDDQNCMNRSVARDSIKAEIEANVKSIAKASLPDIQNYFDKYGWEQMCDYVSWAYTESVELQDSLPKVEAMFDTCQQINKNVTKMYNKLEQNESLKHVSTNDVRKDLLARINQWNNETSKKVQQGKSLNEKESEKPKKGNLEGTAGSEHPKYIMFWTNEANLNLLAQYFGGAAVDELLPLGPSSTVLFEFTADRTGALDVRVIINDQLVPTDQCLGKKDGCKATDFAAKLKDGIMYKDSVSSFCKGKAK